MVEDKDNGLRSKPRETPLNCGKDKKKYKSRQKSLRMIKSNQELKQTTLAVKKFFNLP